MSKVMVIAGGAWQEPIIKKLKEMGHHVLCTNLYPDTPGMLAADEAVVANVLDREQNLEIAKSFAPDLIITDQSDIAVPTVAYVSSQLGLPNIGMDMAEQFTNKYLMRKFEAEHGFKHPAFRECREYGEAVAFLEDVPKAIIKPLNSQSSRGVYVVEKGQEFKDKFEDALSFTHDAKTIIIEQYVEGTEFTVDGLKLGEEYWPLAISEKKHYEHNPSIASELYFSNTNPNYDYDALRDLNKRLVIAMGLPFGMTHAEYKYMDGQFYLIEIAARGGGTKISSDIVPIVSGVEHNKLLINYLLGDKNQSVNPTNSDYCAVLKFIEVEAGFVKKISGLEELKKDNHIIDIQLEFKEGDTIDLPKDDRSRKGFFIAWGETKDVLDRVIKKVNNELIIEVE